MDYIRQEALLKNGQLLVLRKPKVDDAMKMIEYLNRVGGESDYLLFGGNEFHMTVEHEQNYIQSVNSDEESLMLTGWLEDELVCIGQWGCARRERVKHNAEIALSVRKDFWNLGVGSHVLNQLIESARRHPTIEILHLDVVEENIRARVLYEKFGFKAIGIRRNYMKLHGSYHHLILMDLHL